MPQRAARSTGRSSRAWQAVPKHEHGDAQNCDGFVVEQQTVIKDQRGDGAMANLRTLPTPSRSFAPGDEPRERWADCLPPVDETPVLQASPMSSASAGKSYRESLQARGKEVIRSSRYSHNSKRNGLNTGEKNVASFPAELPLEGVQQQHGSEMDAGARARPSQQRTMYNCSPMNTPTTRVSPGSLDFGMSPTAHVPTAASSPQSRLSVDSFGATPVSMGQSTPQGPMPCFPMMPDLGLSPFEIEEMIGTMLPVPPLPPSPWSQRLSQFSSTRQLSTSPQLPLNNCQIPLPLVPDLQVSPQTAQNTPMSADMSCQEILSTLMPEGTFDCNEQLVTQLRNAAVCNYED